jgi:YidC/Oxa1 family membrane protein insertase
MNFRYLYIALVIAFAYMLFLSWGQDSERKKALDHSDYMEKNIKEKIDIDGESAGFIEIQNQKLIVRISPTTGRVWEVRLKEHKFLKNKDSLGVRVFGFNDDKGSKFKFYLGSGFNTKRNYKVVELHPSYLELVSDDGLLAKTISLPPHRETKEDDYEILIEDRFVGQGKGDDLTPYVAMWRTDGKALDSRSGMFENSSYTGVAFNTPDDPYVNSRLRSVDEKQEFSQEGGWIAFIQKYFMAAILTPGDREQTLTITPPKSEGGVYRMAAISQPTKDFDLSSGIEHRIFVGPKIRTDLMTRARDLELTIDMGWFWFLAQPLMMILSVINGFVGNWGISIVLLTILIKLLFWPISSKGFSSMAKMRSAQPKLKEIQERYKDDRAKLGAEMMALYKKEGINPAGGCFPLLLQMPVFISFFFCLRESVELRHESFFFWIQDLSAPDPLFILPVIFAGLMYLTMQLNPQPPGMDPTQAQVMKFMPLMIAGIFVIMPSGLVLYSVANSGISLVQQKAMYKKYGAPNSNGPSAGG